jgi:hypothetical protein
MSDLYSMTTNQDATGRLFKAVNGSVGNLPAMPGIFPDYPRRGCARLTATVS